MHLQLGLFSLVLPIKSRLLEELYECWYLSLDLDLWKDYARPKLIAIGPCWSQKSYENNYARLYWSPEPLLEVIFSLWTTAQA